MTRKQRKRQVPKTGGPRGRRPPGANPRVAEQTRKILRTHYASKYRVR